MDDDEDDLNSHSNSIQSTSIVVDDETIISNIDTTAPRKSETFPSNGRRVRVKFAYSFDNDPVLPITQTTVIKTEPCFKVIAIEDQPTKRFYQNILKKPEKTLDDKDSSQFNKEKIANSKIFDVKQSSPIKSILKKPQKKEKLDQLLVKSHFPSSSKKKEISSKRLDFNEVQHLAEITAKQNLCSPSVHCRSLFDKTINIFDPNYSNRISSNTPRSSRLQYYIKPYRGDPQVSTINSTKQRSRSLPNRSRKSINWHTISNEYPQKQHISWASPRNYVYNERDHIIIEPVKRERISSGKTNSSLLSNSLCFQNIPYRTSGLISPISLYNSNKEDKENMSRSRISKEHDEKLERYDQLLDRIRTTDEQLQSLSRSWMNHLPVEVDPRSNLTLNKMTNESVVFSPMIVQICLIILVIFNLLVVYFFNEINLWWSENIAPGMIIERHNEPIWNF